MGVKSSKQLRRTSSVSSGTDVNQLNNGAEFLTYNDAYDFYITIRSHEDLRKLQLVFTAKGLPKKYPMVVVSERTSEGELKEISRTGMAMKSCEPVWIHPVYIWYAPGSIQPELVFHVYGVDRKHAHLPMNMLKLDEQTFLGKIDQQYLQNFMRVPGGISTLTLSRDRQEYTERTLDVRVEKTVAPTQAFEMGFRCSKLDNKDTFSKSDPFLRISLYNEGQYTAIYETEVVKNNLNPTWKPTNLNFHRKDTYLAIQCFDYNSSGNHNFIGEIRTSVADLERLYENKVGKQFRTRELKEDLEAQIFVESYREKRLYRFSDYLKSNFEIEFIFAVDFTASDGDPSHLLDTFPQVIFQVGESIGFFDFDKRFPFWGFRGEIQNGDAESDCFNLDGTIGQTEVVAIDGMLAAYSQARENITLASPATARFGGVIRKATKHAISQASGDQHKYSVLVIITAGVLADIKETIDALDQASECPLSILIIGVDGADCNQLQMLEAKQRKVQFIPWRELQGGKDSSVEKLFSKLPDQFLEYMERKGIQPLGEIENLT